MAKKKAEPEIITRWASALSTRWKGDSIVREVHSSQVELIPSRTQLRRVKAPAVLDNKAYEVCDYRTVFALNDRRFQQTKYESLKALRESVMESIKRQELELQKLRGDLSLVDEAIANS